MAVGSRPSVGFKSQTLANRQSHDSRTTGVSLVKFVSDG